MLYVYAASGRVLENKSEIKLRWTIEATEAYVRVCNVGYIKCIPRFETVFYGVKYCLGI